MNGASAAAFICGLVVVGTIGFNAWSWLRHKSLAAARGGWTEADFTNAMVDNGVSPSIATAVRVELSAYYMAGLAPRLDDDFGTVLFLDPDELMEIVERLFVRLDIPLPEVKVIVPTLKTVGDLARYIERYPTSP